MRIPSFNNEQIDFLHSLACCNAGFKEVVGILKNLPAEDNDVFDTAYGLIKVNNRKDKVVLKVVFSLEEDNLKLSREMSVKEWEEVMNTFYEEDKNIMDTIFDI